MHKYILAKQTIPWAMFFFIYLFIYSFIYLFVLFYYIILFFILFIYLFIYLFMYVFIYLFIVMKRLNFQHTIFFFFFFFLSENRIWLFMQIVYTGDNLHEMSNPVF